MSQDTVFIPVSELLTEASSSQEPKSANRTDEAPFDLPNSPDSINIVLATDDTYFYPMLCVIKSACENKLDSTKYRFALFVDDDFTDDRERAVNKLLEGYGIPNAKVYNRANEYLDVEYKADHLSRASCYRLQIPTLLAHLDKCIYLDCDTLVRGDLSEFYSLLQPDDLIVGVLAAAYQRFPENASAKAELLGLPDISTYTNSGVMVMNLKLMREIDIEAAFDDMLQRDFPDIDQDILNAACYGRVRLAPPIYNAMTKYDFSEDGYENDPSVSMCWTADEWEQARTDPVIVHFADVDKPWTDFALPFSKEWWGYIDDMGLTTDVFKAFYDLHAKRQMGIYELKSQLSQSGKRLQTAYDEFAVERERLNSNIRNKRDRIKRQKERINVLKERLADQRKRTVAARKELKESRARIRALKRSKSYKIGRAVTKPYRILKGK